MQANQISFKKARQHGGTVLGFILGLAAGLLIALLVALVITKAPVPFANKVARASTEPLNKEMPDPNKNLYGKGAKTSEDTEASKASEVTTPDASSGKPAANKENETANASSTKSGGKNETKPDGKTTEKIVSNKTENSVDVSSDERWNYFIQAGAFQNAADAESLKAKLTLLGLEVKITPRETPNGTLQRVRVGPYGRMDEVNRVRNKLAENNVEGSIIRVPKNVVN